MTELDLPQHGEVGVRLTRDMLMDAPQHPDDDLSRDGRVMVYDLVHSIGDFMREKTGGPKGKHQHRLWGGPKGYGKSGGSNCDAAIFTMMGGYVYSVTGLHYGFRVKKEDFYTYSTTLPHYSWFQVDEVHVYIDSHGQAIRNQLSQENDALLRKINGKMDATSTKDNRLPGPYVEEVDCVFYPSHYVPQRVQESKAQRKDGKADWRLAPYNFVRVDAISPRPFVAAGLREKWKIARPSEKTRKWTKFIEPNFMFLMNHLYNTFATPELGAGILTSGDDLKSHLRGQQESETQRQLVTDFYVAFNKAVIDGWDISPGDSSIHYIEVVGQVRAYGCDMSQRDILQLLRLKGCTMSANRINPRKLLQAFVHEELAQTLSEELDDDIGGGSWLDNIAV